MHVGPRQPVAVNDDTLAGHIAKLEGLDSKAQHEHLLWIYETMLRSVINGTENGNPMHVNIALRIAKEWIGAREIVDGVIVREAENALASSDVSPGEDA